MVQWRAEFVASYNRENSSVPNRPANIHTVHSPLMREERRRDERGKDERGWDERGKDERGWDERGREERRG